MFNSRNSNIKIYFIPFLLFLFIILISLLFILLEVLAKRDYLAYRLTDKIISAEYTFNNELANAKHIIYGLGTTIAEKGIISNKTELNELILNFNRGNDFNSDLTTILTEIIFVDSNQEKIIATYDKNKKSKKNIYIFSNASPKEI